MHTTLTAEGTATRGLLKCFWASRNPRAELCKQTHKAATIMDTSLVTKNKFLDT